MDYKLIGLENYVSKKVRKLLSEVAEQRYDDFLLQNTEALTLMVNDKICDKLSDIIANEFIEDCKQEMKEK